MKAKHILGGLTMLALSGLTVLPKATAQTGTLDLSLKKCGGQNAYRPTPHSCYNEATIDGIQMRVQIYVDADGSFLVEFFRLDASDALAGLQVSAHVGFSSKPDGPPGLCDNSAAKPPCRYSGTMNAGESLQTLTGRFPKPCQASVNAQAHQLDVKFVNGTPNPQGHLPPRYRISGATFVFGPCQTAPPSTVPTTGAPPSSVPSAGGPPAPTGGGGASSRALPETGGDLWGTVYAAFVLLLGGAVLWLHRTPVRAMKRLAGTVLAVFVMMVALTACPDPVQALITKIKQSLDSPDPNDDMADCTILIGMPTLPTLAHPASNTGMYKVQDERYPWEIWSAASAGRIKPLKIETGTNGHPAGSAWLDAVLWPFSPLSWWGTWTTWQDQFMHPKLTMDIWRDAYISARPLGY